LDGTLNRGAFQKRGLTMLIVLVAGILIGAILSLRLNVIVLIPVTCAALTIVAVGGSARGDSFWYIASTMALVVTALQLGYLGGSAFLAVTGSRRFQSQRGKDVGRNVSAHLVLQRAHESDATAVPHRGS
jgi:hypothetical protein